MHRKFTLRERIGWFIVDRLSYWLENESDRQWEKQGLGTQRTWQAGKFKNPR